MEDILRKYYYWSKVKILDRGLARSICRPTWRGLEKWSLFLCAENKKALNLGVSYMASRIADIENYIHSILTILKTNNKIPFFFASLEVLRGLTGWTEYNSDINPGDKKYSVI